MPDLVRVLGQLDALDLALARHVEEAELHLGRVRGEEREVDTHAVPGRTQGVRQAFVDPDTVAVGHGAHPHWALNSLDGLPSATPVP